MSEEPEQTLMLANECFVYKIPPRTTADGYKAQDWGVSNFLWSGKLKVVAKGDDCVVILLDKNNGSEFARAPIPNDPHSGGLEPVVDSSRYFVIRIDDGHGKHAFIGMGFNDRSLAFDFNMAIQDHRKMVKARKEFNENAPPDVDYSFKEGETIKINVNVKAAKPKPHHTSRAFIPPPQIIRPHEHKAPAPQPVPPPVQAASVESAPLVSTDSPTTTPAFDPFASNDANDPFNSPAGAAGSGLFDPFAAPPATAPPTTQQNDPFSIFN
eukprot:TRINITY_DN12569_c0_g1_i1.p1 TRINITY_DN12569_c0_g1~~TRINITY_DN12569_c0_g1_i1.p1  ORF type:complete len:268 (-),score=52.81 TRINITY_DN12569_c0_g1_i1:8-811(-)